jgi:hypothetical protein
VQTTSIALLQIFNTTVLTLVLFISYVNSMMMVFSMRNVNPTSFAVSSLNRKYVQFDERRPVRFVRLAADLIHAGNILFMVNKLRWKRVSFKLGVKDKAIIRQ